MEEVAAGEELAKKSRAERHRIKAELTRCKSIATSLVNDAPQYCGSSLVRAKRFPVGFTSAMLGGDGSPLRGLPLQGWAGLGDVVDAMGRTDWYGRDRQLRSGVMSKKKAERAEKNWKGGQRNVNLKDDDIAYAPYRYPLLAVKDVPNSEPAYIGKNAWPPVYDETTLGCLCQDFPEDQNIVPIAGAGHASPSANGVRGLGG